jgi:hypothetical protein
MGCAFALVRDVETFAASTLRAKRRALERDLDAILSTPTSSGARREARGVDLRLRRSKCPGACKNGGKA